MITVPLADRPCAVCGHAVAALDVGYHYDVAGDTYVGNRARPCGCVHGVDPVTSESSPVIDPPTPLVLADRRALFARQRASWRPRIGV